MSRKIVLFAHAASVLPVVEALASTDDLTLSGAWTDDASVREAILRWHPDCELVDRSEQLLQHAADFCLLAGMSEAANMLAREFARMRVPILVQTDLPAGPEPLFQLMSVRQEHPQALIPLFVSAGPSLWEALREELSRNQPAPLRKVEVHRQLAAHIQLTPSEIDRWLFQDLQWLRRELGDASQITLRTSTDPGGRCIEAEAILTGEAIPEIRWTLLALGARTSLRITQHAGERVVTAEWDADTPAAARLAGEEVQLAGGDARVACAREQLQALATLRQPGTIAADWQEVLDTGAICAVARRSLAKRRTLDIQLDEGSELSQFKSQMTAIGCGALLWALFGSVSLLTVATIIDPRDREYRLSKSGGFVLWESDFENASLTEVGREHLVDITRRWSSTSPVLIIEADVDRAAAQAATRKEQVASQLREAGKRDPDQRITTRPIPGRWFERAVLLGWAIVLAPLAVVLAAQGLIVAARR